MQRRIMLFRSLTPHPAPAAYAAQDRQSPSAAPCSNIPATVMSSMAVVVVVVEAKATKETKAARESARQQASVRASTVLPTLPERASACALSSTRSSYPPTAWTAS